MNIIKNLPLLSLAFVAILLSSCKKNNMTLDPDTKATFVATVDGVVTEFNVHLKGWENSTSPGHGVTAIQGKTSDGTTLTISFLETPIPGKTYSDADTNDMNRPFIVYQTPTDIANGDEYYNDNDDPSNVPSITITSVTSTTLDGTFKGLLIKDPAIDKTDTKLITDGKFHVSNLIHNP